MRRRTFLAPGARRAHRQRRFLAIAVTTAAVATAGAAVLVATRSSTPASRSATAAVTPTLDPGSLPQTPDQPRSRGSELDASVAGLWRAVVTDDPTLAMPFFFPRSAYLQVKAIRDAGGDWQRRLVAAYEQDIHALHARLGAAASRDRLVGFHVPTTATWVQPGVEYNRLSYWRVYDTRVRFTVSGRSDSFTIASMISWRGRWYVVHLARIA